MGIQSFSLKGSGFLVDVEIVENSMLLHCKVAGFSPSVLRALYKVFAQLEDVATRSGLDKMFTITPNKKFASLFGGTSVGVFRINGVEYEEIQWVLKRQTSH